MNNIKMAKGLEIKTNTERVTIENNIVSGSTIKCENLWNNTWVKTDLVNNWNYTSGVLPGNVEQPITPGKQYTFSINSIATTIRYAFLDSDKNYISGLTNGSTTSTAPANAVYLKWRAFDVNITYDEDGKYMLAEGTNITYQPYFTGLRYGYYKGLQLDNFSYIDKTNKIKHIGGDIVDIGSLNCLYEETYNRFKLTVPKMKNASVRTLILLCSIYKNLTNSEPIDSNWNMVIYNDQNNNKIFIHNHAYTNVEDFKTAMQGIPLNYEVAAPSESGIEEF